MSFSLLQTLDETKIKKKQIFIEYVININDKKYTFLVQEGDSAKFEEDFNNADIKSIDDFTAKFEKITLLDAV